MKEVLDYKEVAVTNPSVEPKKIEDFLAYMEILKKMGIRRVPAYRLSPPLSPRDQKLDTTHPTTVRVRRVL